MGSQIDVTRLRLRVGMVFQRANPFPKSIYENIAYAMRVHRYDRSEIAGSGRNQSREAALWDEGKDKLKKSALHFQEANNNGYVSPAQSPSPRSLLMDEPASALDPISTGKIEDLIIELKKKYTIVIVTHSLQQAARISEYCAFFLEGRIRGIGAEHTQMFLRPAHKETEDFITGRFG